MFCSLVSDLVLVEVKYGECLWKRENEWINRRKSDVSRVTLFCCRAFARCCAPWCLISFQPRLSVVSVWKKRENEWKNRRKSDVSCVTLFCCKALARCSAPWCPILLRSR